MHWLKKTTTLLILGGVYYFLAKISLFFFTSSSNTLWLLWLPTGLGPYLYYRYGSRVLISIFFACLFIHCETTFNYDKSLQLLNILVNSIAETFLVFLSGTAACYFLSKGIEKPKQLFMAFIIGCFLPASIYAVLMSLGVHLLNSNHPEALDFIPTAISYALSSILGVLLIIPLLISITRWKSESEGITLSWLISTIVILTIILTSFCVVNWVIFLTIPASIFLVYGSKSFFSYASVFCSISLYIAIAINLHSVESLNNEWFYILSFSISSSFSVIAMTLQKRILKNESTLRKEWQNRANHDALTGLMNRSAIIDCLQGQIESFEETDIPLSISMIDIDHFKDVNDNFGHAAGDLVLKQLSHRINSMTRKTDILGRLGGEEFLLLLPGANAETAKRVLLNLNKSIGSNPFFLSESDQFITFSAGIAEASYGCSVESLLEEADKNLYYAKRTGRNRVSLSNENKLNDEQ